MNRKFEQESTSYYSYLMYKQEIPNPPTDHDRLEAWCEAVQDSVWCSKKDDAHTKYTSMYANMMEEKAHIDHI